MSIRFCTKIICCISLLFLTKLAIAQDNIKWQYSAGIGMSLLGSGDHTAISFANAVDYRVNRYLELSAPIVFGRGQSSWRLFSASFFQANLNVLFVPTSPDNKYALKIGGGISLFSYDAVTLRSSRVDQEGKEVISYRISDYTTIGYNLLFVNSYDITQRHSIALQAFGQTYVNGDTNFGALLLAGYKF